MTFVTIIEINHDKFNLIEKNPEEFVKNLRNIIEGKNFPSVVQDWGRVAGTLNTRGKAHEGWFDMQIKWDYDKINKLQNLQSFMLSPETRDLFPEYIESLRKTEPSMGFTQ